MLQPLFRLITRGKLTVLLFHKVPVVGHPLDPGEMDLAGFQRVLKAAMRLFTILPLEDAMLALRAGNLPPRAACITFDDGYPEWLSGVVPELERQGVHATFFVTTGQFTGSPLWNERILHAIATVPDGSAPLVLSDDLPPLAVSTASERQAAVHALARELKYREPGRRSDLLLELESRTGHSVAQVPVMSADELRDLHARGFGIGGHSVTHPILSHCTPAQAYEEIAGAKETLEAIVRGKVTAFAYPNGVPEKDFAAEHVAMVRRAGYTLAVTTHRGTATASTSMFQVPRFSPWGPSAGRMALQFARNLQQPSRHLVEEQTPGQKRALMVAFHFPPQAGSSGILRTLNFVKYLPESGWQPTVLTAGAKAYTEQRNDLVASIPSQTRVLRGFALDAARHLSIAGKYPLALALPDRWSSWWPGAVLAGRRELRRTAADLIWSTYPISTAHLIAASLSRWSGLPWVADFRDPMVSDGYPSAPMQRRIWMALEERVMRQAAACVFTTERAARQYAQRYPAAAHKCHVIENGYEEEVFEQVQPARVGLAPSATLMLHSGLIYPNDRNPSSFFAAVEVLLRTGELDRQQLRIRFRAPQHGEEVKAFAARYGLQDIVEIAPPIPYREAIAEMMGADLLIVFQGSHFNAQIPAKIYEYLRAQRPLMAVLDPAGDTAAQLRRFEGVLMSHIDDQADVERGLREWMRVRGTAQHERQLLNNTVLVRRYSRRAQAGALAQLLSSVTADGVARVETPDAPQGSARSPEPLQPGQ